MKVGLLTSGFPRFEGDHSGGFLLTLARGLVAHGHEVRVLAPDPEHDGPAPSWPGIDVYWVPYARPKSLQRTFYRSGAPDNLRAHPLRWVGAASFSASLAIHARRTLRDCDALVSSWCVPSGWIASTLARGRDHLGIVHETDLRWLERIPGRRRLARAIARGASALWFLSEAHRDRFFALSGVDGASYPAHVGPMPIDVAPPSERSRASLRRELGIDGFTVLFLGRLVPDKGLARLIRAVAPLRESVRLRVAGDGPDRGAAEALAQRLGVDAAFEGWVVGERKEALLRACDALVVPSVAREGLPTVLFEARARGMPVVATRVGAIEDALRHQRDATLVAPGDGPALTEAIAALRA